MSIEIGRNHHGEKNPNYKGGVIKNNCYSSLAEMKKRCYKQSHKFYKNYGGRGITICKEWLENSSSFVNWAMNNGYKKGLSIDRINNDGNYEPSNCRWVDNFIQQRNKKVIQKNNTSGYKGVKHIKKYNKFEARIGVNNKLIFIGIFQTAKDAGYAYDKYVIDNNLEHNTNGLYKKEIV